MIKSVLVFHLCISVHKDNPPPIKDIVEIGHSCII